MLGVVRGGFLALTVVVTLVVGAFHATPKVVHHTATKPLPKMITILWFGGSRPLPHALGIRPHLERPVVHHKATHKTVASRVETSGGYMGLLPPASRATFTCVMWRESRSTPTDFHNYREVNPEGAAGIFQFMPPTWQYGARALGISAQYAQNASIADQFRVAAFFWNRNGGIHPEWDADGC